MKIRIDTWYAFVDAVYYISGFSTALLGAMIIAAILFGITKEYLILFPGMPIMFLAIFYVFIRYLKIEQTRRFKKCDHCDGWFDKTTNIKLDGEPCELCDVCYYVLKEKYETED